MTSKDESYYVAGGRTGVLLMHGLGGTPTEMRLVANGLARAGYTVYCPQLAGHGGTEVDRKETTWQDWYASAEQALARLRQECDVVIVGGLSTGAVLALLLAARHPEDVQATALLAPTFCLNGRLIPWYARLFRIVSSMRIANLIGFPDLHPHGTLKHRLLVNAVRAEIGNIRQPALIIHPREGHHANLDNASYLQRNLRGLVDMVVLDDSYQLVVERTTAFVADVTKAVTGKTSPRVTTPAFKAA
jgi:carboxylesterase